MKNSVSLVLIVIFLVLFSFALVEKAKWSRNNPVIKISEVHQGAVPALVASHKTEALSSLGKITKQAIDENSNMSKIWIEFKFDIGEDKLKKIKSDLESRLAESRQLSSDHNNKSKKYVFRFVSGQAGRLQTDDDQFKLTGRIDQKDVEKWHLKFKLEKSTNTKKASSISEQEFSFPLPSPMQNYKMKIENSVIAAQMSALLIKESKKFFELELSKKSLLVSP